jgi:hypothetical protein
MGKAKIKGSTKPLSKEGMKSRKKRAKRDGKLHSSFLLWKTEQDRRNAQNLLYQICFLIWAVFYQDDLKAPLNNRAKPASISRASTNFYFGMNCNRIGDKVVRTSYAMGSGQRTIGLDPSTTRLFQMIDEMWGLVALVNKAVANKPLCICHGRPPIQFLFSEDLLLLQRCQWQAY